MFDELSTDFFALDDFASHNLSFLPITIATFDNFSGKIAIFYDCYIEIYILMSFLLHSLLLMTLLDIISTCNAFPIENHTDHQK